MASHDATSGRYHTVWRSARLSDASKYGSTGFCPSMKNSPRMKSSHLLTSSSWTNRTTPSFLSARKNSLRSNPDSVRSATAAIRSGSLYTSMFIFGSAAYGFASPALVSSHAALAFCSSEYVQLNTWSSPNSPFRIALNGVMLIRSRVLLFCILQKIFNRNTYQLRNFQEFIGR